MDEKANQLCGAISIGYEGENEARVIPFYIGHLLRQWPSMTPKLMAQRPGETDVYPCRFRIEGDLLYWEITENDTAKAGQGEARVYMLGEDGEIGKSEIVYTQIGGGMEGEMIEDPPPAIRPYILDVMDAADRAEEAAKKAEEIAGSVGGGSGGESTPGKDGISPIVTLEDTAEGVDITVTDAEGTKTATVRHGKDGADGYTPVKGIDYFDGKDGAPGEKGEKGETGEQGIPGEKGEKGDKGDAGERGEKGEQGDQGLPGAKGDKGDKGDQGEQGVPGEQGIPGEKGDKGDPGSPGQDGADGISPTVSVQDITGGHRVTITDKDGSKTFDVMDGKDGADGSGGGTAIVDVTELPERDIDDDVFYRVVTAEWYYNSTPQKNVNKCYVVDTLPETGEPAVNATIDKMTTYYATDTGAVSAYVTEELAAVFYVPAGWYPAEVLMSAVGYEYGGIVDSIDKAIGAKFYLLVQDSVKYHNNNEWKDLQGIGWYGRGIGSEIFNSLLNTTDGDASHAEGFYTSASGLASHAEGSDTRAIGDASHAEGIGTTASGDASHAEGSDTRAIGDASHAEGIGTTANSLSQHVEGEYNIEDTVPDENSRGKYIHIAGNGDYTNRSNAHTLDWNGVPWYQSRPQFGGKEQDDGAQTVMANGDTEIILASPSGKLYGITVSDDGVLTATAK